MPISEIEDSDIWNVKLINGLYHLTVLGEQRSK